MSKNDVSKQRKKPFDFFTETVICFTIKSAEYKIKLGICGHFNPTTDNGVIPIPSKYDIVEIEKGGKKIESSPLISNFVNKWIKNNSSKLTSFVSRELGIMIKLSQPPPTSQNMPSVIKK